MNRTLLFVILIVFLIGALPTWPYSSGWGCYPSGGLGLLAIILVVLILPGATALFYHGIFPKGFEG
jgi:hypothetical protein